MHEEATDKITYTLGSMIYSNEGLSETQYYVPCVALGLASFVASVFFLYRYSLITFKLPRWRRVKLIVARHYRYGKWALVTGLALWVPANLYFFILPFIISSTIILNESF